MAYSMTERWKRTSPIPTDPVYSQSSRSQRSEYKGRERRNPIPTDPMYTSDENKCPETAPKPRIKSEALGIARLHQGGALAQLFNPAFKVIPIGSRPKTQERRDFGQENYQKIKQIQRANKERQRVSAREEPVKAVYKPGKFDHVGSKVAEKVNNPPPAPRPSSANFLRAHSHSGPNVKIHTRPASVEPIQIREERLTVPKASVAKQVRPERKSINHISDNVRKAKGTQIKRAPSLTALDDLKKKKETELHEYNRGNVPKYLRQRQMQWKHEEEVRKANMPDPTIPAGHSLMPDDERRKTLAMLQKSQSEMLAELQSLPVSKDTLRVKQRKELLERKLQEVETAITMFSRPRVFVRDE